MAVSHVRVSRLTRQKLGQATINEVCRHLYPLDCQVCGQPLRAAPPGLSVDEFRPWSGAWLHHTACAKPAWNIRAAVSDMALPRRRYLSNHTYSLMMRPTVFPGTGLSVPIALVNPSMEAVRLYRDGEGWRVDDERFFCERFGMQRSSATAPLADVQGCRFDRVVTRDDDGAIFSLSLGSEQWMLPTPRVIADTITRSRGAVLLISTALDPHSVEDDDFGHSDLAALVASGQFAAGWASLTPPHKPEADTVIDEFLAYLQQSGLATQHGINRADRRWLKRDLR